MLGQAPAANLAMRAAGWSGDKRAIRGYPCQFPTIASSKATLLKHGAHPI